MKTLSLVLASFVLLVSAAARASDHPDSIPLWPNGAPGSEGKTAPEILTETNDVWRVESIHNPSITPFLPSKETATGAAIVILPGGGHRYLSIENEGYAIGKWLAEHGIAGFVLKYRLAKEPNSTYRVDVEELQDAQRALRLVRSRAKEWNLDPQRIGLLGLSAGGEVTKLASARFDSGRADASDAVEREGSRPAFQILMYPGGRGDMDVLKDTPPTFVLVAADDRLSVGSVTYFQKVREAGIPAEIHVYAKGGHGFGMRNRPLPITQWTTRVADWLGDQGFLKGSDTKAAPAAAAATSGSASSAAASSTQ
jgi:acetyl esterase/lipase